MLKKFMLAFVLVAAMAGTAFASDVDDVNAATEALRLAMISGDKAELEKYVMPDMIYVHSAGKVENARQFVDAIATGSAKLDTFTKVEFNNQKVATNGSLAVVTHIFDGEASTKGRDGGKPYSIHIGVTQVWKKDNGQWKLMARKASLIPF